MKKDRVRILFEDMTYNSQITFLEEGKDKDELTQIGKKRGLKLPSPDLSVFKCVYAFVDTENKNRCTLPEIEVDKALDTLIGKAIDVDHFRKRTIGHWIDSFRDNKKIFSYGAFWKSNFEDEYKEFKEKMEKGELKVSFEAWGDRNFTDGNSYNLIDIHFAGGALLDNEKPAFDNADVLEFAKVMETGNPQLNEPTELARFYIWDANSIIRLLNDVDCLSCKEKGMYDILNMDFENNKTNVKCVNCEAKMAVDLTPTAKLTKKGRKVKQLQLQDAPAKGKEEQMFEFDKIENLEIFLEEYNGIDEDFEMALIKDLEGEFEEGKKLKYEERKSLSDDSFAVVKTVKNKISGKSRKIRMFPIHDESHVRNALARLGQPGPQATLKKLGISVESVKNKILRRAKELNMKTLLERYKKGSVEELVQMFAKEIVGRELTSEELEKAYTIVEYAPGGGKGIDTSLNTPPGGQSTANPTSLQNAKETTEDELKEAIKKAIEKAPDDAKNKEMSDLKSKLSDYENKLKEATDKLVEATKKITELDVEAKKKADAEKASKIKIRKDELGEFAKDITDEELLNDDKYTVLKMKKENASMKKVIEKAHKDGHLKDEDMVGLEIGSADKEREQDIVTLQKKVKELAFGSDSNKE